MSPTLGERIARCVENEPLSFYSEAGLQDELWVLFERQREVFGRPEREVALGPGARIDFLVGDVGVEVKCAGGPTPVVRQLCTYAESSRVKELVLVTSRLQLCQMPAQLLGKSVRVASVFGFGTHA